MLTYMSKLTSEYDKGRSFVVVMKEVNETLSAIHKTLAKQIDISKYEVATNYVNQYISYTTVWNLKFIYNIESPEVALLQCLHLDYILERENTDGQFSNEVQILNKMYTLFLDYSTFSDEQIENRKLKMLDAITLKLQP